MAARDFFEALPARAEPDKIAGIENSYLFEIEGEGRWLVKLSGGAVTVTEDPAEAGDVTISTTSEVFDRVAAGEQNPAVAVMTGKIKLTGDTGAALKLQKLF